MNKIIILLISALLTACVSVGTKIDTSKLTSLEKGKTTFAEVIQTFGKPTAIATTSSGQKIVAYNFSKAQASASSFIPFVGIFIGSTDAEATAVNFMFDKNNLLESYTTTSSNITASPFRTTTK